jgi:hypothetical protein
VSSFQVSKAAVINDGFLAYAVLTADDAVKTMR